MLVSVINIHIERKGQGLLQAHGTAAVVDDPHAAHDRVGIAENGIGQQEADMEDRILHGDLQGHGIIGMAECRRKSFQPVLALVDAVGDIVGLQDCVAALCADRHSAVSVVARQLPGKLMMHAGQHLAALAAIGGNNVGILLVAQHVAQVGIADSPAEIDMLQELLVIHDRHDIADMFRIDLKNSFLFKKLNVHLFLLCRSAGALRRPYKSAENRAENVPFSVRKLSSYEIILMEKRGFFNA